MRGLSQRKILYLVRTDVARIKRHAAYVVCLEGSGSVSVQANPDPLIDVIGVIGPGHAFGQDFPQAVLCEVGIRRARPWQRLRGVTARRPLLSLTREQYLIVAPTLFRILQDMTNQVVSGWKRGPQEPIYLWHSRTRFFHGIRRDEGPLFIPHGCCFSVAVRDRMLLADLYWTALNGGGSQRIRGFGRYAEMALAHSGTGKRHQRILQELGFEIDRRITRHGRRSSWPSYQIWASRRSGKLRRTKGVLLLERFLQRQLEWRGGEMPEEILASSALGGVRQRVAGLHVRDISGTRPGDRDRSYVVFEMMPSTPLEEVMVSRTPACSDSVCPQERNPVPFL